MAGIIYTNQRSKLSKKQRAARDDLIKDQRETKRLLKSTSPVAKIPTYSIPANRGTKHLNSLDLGIGVAVKKETPTYTGTAMIGIGQMHKSNAVPIFKQESAEDLAKMRR